MTNNETTFFRDARMFAMLRKSMLPELVARAIGERSLNIWCAACSTGQEPYSVAMLLREQPALARRLEHPDRSASDMSRECSPARGPAATASSRSTAACRRTYW